LELINSLKISEIKIMKLDTNSLNKTTEN
jgi:hypothetical protein